MRSTEGPHEPGSAVVVRTVTAGRIRWASAAVCVRDDEELLAFFQSNLTPNNVTAAAAARWPDRRAREVALREELARGEFVLAEKVPAKGAPSLTVACHGDWFSVRFVQRHSWQPEYVNVCLPYRRSTIGFDTDDLCLDVVLEQRSDETVAWHYKDDEDLDERAELGLYRADQVHAIRAAASVAIDRLRAGAPPFDGCWTHWSPDADWASHRGLPSTWADDVIHLSFS